MKTGKKLIQAIQQYNPQPGTLGFWWLGQMGFAVRTACHTLYFDPFLSYVPGRVIPSLLAPEELTNAEYVFGSHDHDDHIDRKAWPTLAKASEQCRFVIPMQFTKSLPKELAISEQRFIGIDIGHSYEENGVKIFGVPSAHEMLDTDPETGLHPYMGFVVETDGMRIYHSGDSCVYEGLQTALKSFGHIDIAFLPINGRDGYRLRHNCIGNMSFMEAADLAGALRPGLVVPAHYEMFENNRFLTEAMLFAEFVEAKYPEQRFWIGAHGECVEVHHDEEE